MLPINRPVRAVTQDGRTIRGRRLNEDTYTVQLIDEQERLVSLVKADLQRVRARQDVADAVVRGQADRRRAGGSGGVSAVVEGAAMNTLDSMHVARSWWLLASYQLHAQVVLRSDSPRRGGAAQLADLLAAPTPASATACSTDHAGERHATSSRSGCCRTRCSAPGSRRRSSSTASCTSRSGPTTCSRSTRRPAACSGSTATRRRPTRASAAARTIAASPSSATRCSWARSTRT